MLDQHRLLATIEETKAGRGVLFRHNYFEEADERRLKEDFLNMNPQIILLGQAKE